MRLRGRRADCNVGTHFFEAGLRDAPDGEQIIHAAKWAAFLAELEDVVCSDGPDAGELLKLIDCSCVQIDGLCRRRLLRRGNRGACGSPEQKGGEKGERESKAASSPFTQSSIQHTAPVHRLIALVSPVRRIQ
jgi:hypothetical protein